MASSRVWDPPRNILISTCLVTALRETACEYSVITENDINLLYMKDHDVIFHIFISSEVMGAS